MMTSRRDFLEGVLPSALILAVSPGLTAAVSNQAPQPRGLPPTQSGSNPAEPPRSKFPTPPDLPDPLAPKPDPRAILKQNQETIKRDVKRLAQLARELESEMEKTNSAEVLSLQFVRRAEEIEKLARNIKNLARG